MLREQEQSKNEAYTKKLLQDCETSLKIDEENRKVTELFIL